MPRQEVAPAPKALNVAFASAGMSLPGSQRVGSNLKLLDIGTVTLMCHSHLSIPPDVLVAMQSIGLCADRRAFWEVVAAKLHAAGRYDSGQATGYSAEQTQGLVDDGIEQRELFQVRVVESVRKLSDFVLQRFL